MVQPDDDADPPSLIQGLYRQFYSTSQPNLKYALPTGSVLKITQLSLQWFSDYAPKLEVNHPLPLISILPSDNINKYGFPDLKSGPIHAFATYNLLTT